MKIGLYRQFRPKTNVEYSLNSQGFEKPVEIKVLPVKAGGRRRGHNGDNADSLPEVLHKNVKIVQADAGIVGTGTDTFAAAYTKIAVVVYDIPGPVVTHFGGTDHNAAMAINALVLQHMNNRS
jgi:hypothetical protein